MTAGTARTAQGQRCHSARAQCVVVLLNLQSISIFYYGTDYMPRISHTLTCARTRTRTHEHTHIYIHIYINM